MSIVKVFYGGKEEINIEAENILMYDAEYKAGEKASRHPIITTRRNGKCNIEYLLGALYREEPLVIKDGSLQYLSLHNARKIQFSPDNAADSTQLVQPKLTTIRMSYYDGDTFDFAQELVIPYDVKNVGTKNAIPIIQKGRPCDMGELFGMFARQEPFLVAHQINGEGREIISMSGVRTMHFILPDEAHKLVS